MTIEEGTMSRKAGNVLHLFRLIYGVGRPRPASAPTPLPPPPIAADRPRAVVIFAPWRSQWGRAEEYPDRT